MRPFLLISIAAVVCLPAGAEEADVKYRGRVDLAPFTCTEVESSFVRRVCFDKRQSYMLIHLRDTYYHYCSIPDSVVSALSAADSVGRFYNAQVKGNYDCRMNPPPKY
jgi:hypothetical protein